MNSEMQSESCSMVLGVLGCVQACFRVSFTRSWIGRLGSPIRKGVCESSGVPRLKQDASENALGCTIGHFGTKRDF
ncbi:hypothetical protein CDL15_Pgr008293 [Punica granatum]|uniref:Uncharacterized protein n=1 Tax=Punica granatum TaxID=22663 RepID=A0A218WPH6_PUNGR|nr:hypothetical protein CDL15_Pgr008293 [Punica granatum]